jgi:signal transduction histidine kinase
MTPHKDNVVAAIDRARTELDRALTELAGLPAFDPGVIGFATHALKNYLTVADGTVDLLSMALASYPDNNVHNWLQALRQATGLMHHTVGQLVSSSPSTKPRLVFTRFDMIAGVRRACDYYQRFADRKQIRLLFEPAADVPFIWSDRVAAAAVLDNLLSNAVKYSDPGKRIWVRLQAQPGSVVCSVQDEGPGLSPEDQARLFQKGVRLSPAPTAGEPSTGFGLAVAKELVGQLGGEIWCESQLGQGACFSFRLPVGEEGTR